MDFEKLQNIFKKEECDNLETLYNFCKGFYSEKGLFSDDFATQLVDNIISNRLDYNSVSIGVIYPAYKNNPDLDLSDKVNAEIVTILHRIAKIESYNLSTHQEQLENIKNMFIAIAKDIRVVIIKLCIEETKLNFLQLMSDDEKSKYMQ